MTQLTAGEVADNISVTLQSAGNDNPRLEARILLAYVLGVEQMRIFSHPEMAVSDAHQQQLEKLVTRRLKKEPIALIVGEKEFWSHTFKVNEQTLVPRPDTETLIAAAVKIGKNLNESLRVLDLGTGSGCILLSILSEFENATGVGIDLNDKALAVAAQNARSLELVSRSEFRQGHWMEGLKKNFPDGFSMVVSNPPYIPNSDIPYLMTDVTGYEPHLALRGGEDGLDCYREIASQLDEVLQSGGYFICEIGQEQEIDVEGIFSGYGYRMTEKTCDLAGIVRCLIFRSQNREKEEKNTWKDG